MGRGLCGRREGGRRWGLFGIEGGWDMNLELLWFVVDERKGC